MTDTVQAKKNLQFCYDELIKYQNLSRTGLRHSELVALDNIIIRLKEQIKNLRTALHARCQAINRGLFIDLFF